MAWDFSNPFTLPRIPIAEDIDGLNHVNNAAYIRWCEGVAWGHSEALGIAMTDYQQLDRAVAIRRAIWASRREGRHFVVLSQQAGPAARSRGES